MEKHSIQTAQNVTIDFEIASLGARIGSTLIDVLFLYIFTSLLSALLPSSANTDGLKFLNLTVVLPFFFYYLITNILMNGQTLGKYILKIRVIKITGHQLSIGDHIIRWLFWNLEVLSIFIIALFSCLFTRRTQRIGDLAANSIVISINSKTSLKETLFENVQDSYNPVYPEVVHLKDADAELVKEVIHRNKTKNDLVAKEALIKICVKLEKTLKIKAKDHDQVNFLKTILMDYNFYTQKMD